MSRQNFPQGKRPTHRIAQVDYKESELPPHIYNQKYSGAKNAPLIYPNPHSTLNSLSSLDQGYRPFQNLIAHQAQLLQASPSQIRENPSYNESQSRGGTKHFTDLENLNYDDNRASGRQHNPNKRLPHRRKKHSNRKRRAKKHQETLQNPEEICYDTGNGSTITSKVYISFEANLSQEDLHRAFSRFGVVTNAYLCKKHKKGPFIFGFVEFQDLQDAERVIQLRTVVYKCVQIRVKPVTEKNSVKAERNSCRQKIYELDKHHEKNGGSTHQKKKLEMEFKSEILLLRSWNFRLEIEIEPTRNARLFKLVDLLHRVDGAVCFNKVKRKVSGSLRALNQGFSSKYSFENEEMNADPYPENWIERF